MNWTRPGQDDALKFLNAVKDDAESAIFDPSLCEVHALPLPFYDGYALVRIVNRHMMPFLVLDYASNGENHYYMDGSEAPFHNLNARHALNLDESNVIDYLDFYISYVYERGSSLGFIRPESGSAARLPGFNGKTFSLEAPLNYHENTIQARIDIETNGAIHIRDPLRVSFMTELQPGQEIRYRHPHEADILEETRELLRQTPTGEKLLGFAAGRSTETRVLCSPNYQGFITGSGLVYITMPAAENSAGYLQALTLAYGLRDVQQIAQGFVRRRRAEDRTAFIQSNYLKNLDIIVEMCKIVSEFGEKGMPEALTDLEGMALGSVYRAYKQGAEGLVLMQVYLDSLDKAGLMTGD